MSFFKCRIETFQPDTHILAGELPVNLGMNPIPKRLGLIRLERLVKRLDRSTICPKRKRCFRFQVSNL